MSGETDGGGYILRTAEKADVRWRRRLHEQIREFNNQASPPHREVRARGQIRPIDLWIESADGELLAGLSSDTYWDWWEINDLWVHERQRNRGHGGRLMQMAEEEARRRWLPARLYHHIQLSGTRLLRKAWLSHCRPIGRLSARGHILLAAQGL